MKNKEIQNQRMRGYFIQATKEILKGEGLRNISVRNIANQAGYSYATLYNYFKDAKDLVFECVVDFQEECTEFVKQEIDNELPGIAKIKAISKAYIKFFIQYPSIFELFYIEGTYNLAGKQPTVSLVNTFLDRLCADEWEMLLTKGSVSETQIQNMREGLNYLVLGMLLLYLNRGYPQSYAAFSEKVDQQLNNILDMHA